MTGHHRKYGIRLLGQSNDDGEQQPAVKKGRRIYDEAAHQAVIVVWEAADRIYGKRLKSALPHLVESMERHGHLDLDPGVRQRLLVASAGTLEMMELLQEAGHITPELLDEMSKVPPYTDGNDPY